MIHTASGLAVSLEDKTASLSLTRNEREEEKGRYDVRMFVNGAWRRVRFFFHFSSLWSS
jgi:hypothetical protein